MYRTRKRDNKIVDFDLSKISHAITQAFEACDRDYNPDTIDFLALKVTADFEPKIKDGLIAVEDIQDSVEAVLIKADYADVAKAYILYRKQREKLRNMKSTMLDYKELVNSYVKVYDWRVKENSTVTYSVGGLILSQLRRHHGELLALRGIRRRDRKRTPQCGYPPARPFHADRLLRRMVPKAAYPGGARRRPGKDHLISGKPSRDALQSDGQFPRHHAERMGGRTGVFLLRYLSCAVCQGGQPVLSRSKKVHRILHLTASTRRSRWGTQAPFSNITLDWTVPDGSCRTLPAIVGGKEMPISPTGTAKRKWIWSTSAFIETMIEGDANGRGFQYPIPTYSITQDFDWSETENNQLLFEMTAKYGTPYFSNYINSDMQPSGRPQHVLPPAARPARAAQKIRRIFRLRREHRLHRRRHHQHAEDCLPLPRTRRSFYQRLDHMMDISARSLKTKRTVITKLMERGALSVYQTLSRNL